MKASDIDFKQSLNFAIADGRVTLGRERVVLVRQESLGVLRALLYEQLGSSLARATLSQFGYRCGQDDYAALAETFAVERAEDRLQLAFALQAWLGAAALEVTSCSHDQAAGALDVAGWWRNSYEAEVHLAHLGPDEHPVCHALAGYLSGWCTAFLGRPVLAIETRCMGQGEERCEFRIRPDAAWGGEAARWRVALTETSASLSTELERQTALIQEQEAAISELSTPVMEIWDDILVLPIVGVVDTRRSLELMTNLLDRIVETQSRCVIIDVTGVEVVDTKTADYLLKVIRAANLLGSRCVLTGLSPAIAQTLVEIGADLTEVNTLRNIKDGLKDCLRYIRSQRVDPKAGRKG
ncbi:MAG: XylR N-terminal domain-containing protein [Myxococcales bacterium]|nr:XylR N-terminal domain-containing protein [Myxococcales bacterium]